MKKLVIFLLFITISISLLSVTNGALNGKFTIDAQGNQVVFSQGNLQYKASADTWRFAKNQYDTIGSRNSNISDSYTGWIDLFGWGTGDNPTKTDVNEYTYTTFKDWGENPISNGGDEPNQWRTLTFLEWVYILHTRPNCVNLRGKATVNNVRGYILLPDEWSLPKDLHFTPDPADWTTNTYYADEWQEMEESGAVLLVAAGFRFGVDNVGLFGDWVMYWSSTPIDEYAAGCVGFFNNFENTQNARSNGEAVRLVQDLSPTATAIQSPVVEKNSQSTATKHIKDGHVYILSGEQMYNTIGQQVY